MPQPTDALIRIAQSDMNTPKTGEANKKEPNTTIKTMGWDLGQIFAGNHLNYIFDNLAKWITWGQEQIDTLSQSLSTELSNLRNYVDQQDTAILESANNSATQYTDTEIQGIKDTTITAGDGLSGGGNLSQNRSLSVDNTVVRTSRKVNDKDLSSDITLSSTDIGGASTAILAGTANDADTLPLPSGYTISQCKFMVSINDTGSGAWDIDELDSYVHFRVECSVNQSTGVVTAKRHVYQHNANSIQTTSATVNYIVIGIK